MNCLACKHRIISWGRPPERCIVLCEPVLMVWSSGRNSREVAALTEEQWESHQPVEAPEWCPLVKEEVAI